MMSRAADVVATRLNTDPTAATLQECADYVRVGGALTKELIESAVKAAKNDVFLGNPSAKRADMPVKPVFGGSKDLVVGTAQAKEANADAGLPYTNAVLDLLAQLVEHGEKTLILSTSLPLFLGERLTRVAIAHADVLTDAQVQRVASLVRTMYVRFPESRRGTRVILRQCVADSLTGANVAAAVSNHLATLVEVNEMGQMDGDEEEIVYQSPQDRGTMGPPTTMPPRAAQVAAAAKGSGDLRRQMAAQAAELYAVEEERQHVACLPLALELIGAIGGGLSNPAAKEHQPMVQLLERVMVRGGMLDELTSLVSVYLAPLKRCLVAWCSADKTGALVQQFVRIAVHEWPDSIKNRTLVLQIVQALLEVTPSLRLGAQRSALIGFLAGPQVLASPEFAQQQRCAMMLNEKACREALLMEDADDDGERQLVTPFLVSQLVTALSMTASTTFSQSTGKACVRAAVLCAKMHPQVEAQPMVQQMVAARAAEQAQEDAEAAEKERRGRMRRDDLTYMRLAWHKHLGVGAYATVRSALAIEPGTPQRLWVTYAVKVMQQEQIAAENARPRIEAEVALLASLDHPNVVAFVSFFEDAKRLFLVMELASGGDVHDVIMKMGSVDPHWAKFVVAETAAALSYLHAQGIIHFDVKPENLLLNGRGRVLLADFGSCLRFDTVTGVARQYADADAGTHIQLTSTAEYVAKELAEAALAGSDDGPLCVPSTAVGPAADWWSLGCVLYQLLRGQVPFVAVVPQGAENERVSDRSKLETVAQQSATIGPLFVPGSMGDRADCECAVRALLHKDPSQRWTGLADPGAAAFFAAWSDVPPAPKRGQVRADQVAMHVKQRRFSMMWTAMTQNSFVDTDVVHVDRIEEEECDKGMGWR